MHRARDLDGELGSVSRLPEEVADRVGQAAARKEPHREEVTPSGLPELVDRHDVVVLKPSGRLRLEAEAKHVRVVGELSRQTHLHRDRAVQLQIADAVDDPHAAAADLVEDLVAGDLGGRARGVAIVGDRLGGDRLAEPLHALVIVDERRELIRDVGVPRQQLVAIRLGAGLDDGHERENRLVEARAAFRAVGRSRRFVERPFGVALTHRVSPPLMRRVPRRRAAS